jgi:hypothetical protein
MEIREDVAKASHASESVAMDSPFFATHTASIRERVTLYRLDHQL